jgi:hypothetical protein
MSEPLRELGALVICLLLQVFSDGLRIASVSYIHLRDLTRVPHVGHIWVLLFQGPVCFPPVLIHRLSFQLPLFAAVDARRVGRVRRRHAIYELADRAGVN